MSKHKQKTGYACIAIGTSHGGFEALKSILWPLPKDFSVPILIVRHQAPDTDEYVISALQNVSALNIAFAENGETPQPGNVYLAPPDQHMTIDANGAISLKHGPKINYSRPAIDPLFESVSAHYGSDALAIVLTGANNDGAKGAAMVKSQGGTVIVQDPNSAEAPEMPNAALEKTKVDEVVWLDQIGPHIWTLCRMKN